MVTFALVKAKKKFEFPNTYVIVFFLIVLAAVATWFVPGGEFYKTEEGLTAFRSVPSEPQTWQVFTTLFEGFTSQAGIIVFILVIAALVQMVEIILKKVSPSLYQALGIFLPLITTNCAVLGVAIMVIQKEMTLLQSITYACGIAIGFTLALVIFAGIREQLALSKVPKAMQGIPIALVTAGILAMAFMGFSGLV